MSKRTGLITLCTLCVACLVVGVTCAVASYLEVAGIEVVNYGYLDGIITSGTTGSLLIETNQLEVSGQGGTANYLTLDGAHTRIASYNDIPFPQQITVASNSYLAPVIISPGVSDKFVFDQYGILVKNNADWIGTPPSIPEESDYTRIFTSEGKLYFQVGAEVFEVALTPLSNIRRDSRPVSR